MAGYEPSREQRRQFFDLPIVEWSMFAPGLLLVIGGLTISPIAGSGGIFLIAPGLALSSRRAMEQAPLRPDQALAAEGRAVEDWGPEGRAISGAKRTANRNKSSGPSGARIELPHLLHIGAHDSGRLFGGPFSLIIWH